MNRTCRRYHLTSSMVALEKLLPFGGAAARVNGVALIAAAVWMIVA